MAMRPLRRNSFRIRPVQLFAAETAFRDGERRGQSLYSSHREFEASVDKNSGHFSDFLQTFILPSADRKYQGRIVLRSPCCSGSCPMRWPGACTAVGPVDSLRRRRQEVDERRTLRRSVANSFFPGLLDFS